jgi:hypothetical protein
MNAIAQFSGTSYSIVAALAYFFFALPSHLRCFMTVRAAHQPPRARVRAAFRAAAERPLRPLVWAARRAEAERWACVRRRAAERACLASSLLEAALRRSRLSTRSLACERRRDGFGLPR